MPNGSSKSRRSGLDRGPWPTVRRALAGLILAAAWLGASPAQAPNEMEEPPAPAWTDSRLAGRIVHLAEDGSGGAFEAARSNWMAPADSWLVAIGRHADTPSAILIATRQRAGCVNAFRTRTGTPRLGDRVIIPGRELTQLIAATLQASDRNAP